MKSYFLLFLFTNVFSSWMPVPSSNSAMREHVIQRSERTLQFNVEEVVYDSRHVVAYQQVDKLTTPESWNQLSKIYHTGNASLLSLEIEKDLYFELLTNKDTQVQYRVNYNTIVEWTNSQTQLHHRLWTEFNLDYDGYWNPVNHSSEQEKGLLSFQETNVPEPQEQSLLFLGQRLNIERTNQKYFLKTNVDLAWNLEPMQSLFATLSKTNLTWNMMIVLQSLEVQITHEQYDFDAAKPMTRTFFYSDKSEVVVQSLKQRYLNYLRREFFVELQSEFPHLEFNFDKFYRDYDWVQYDPDLQINHLNFVLEVTNQKHVSGNLHFSLLLVFQEFVNLSFSSYYQVERSEFPNFLKGLATQIQEQGYNPNVFGFEVRPTTITISTLNPDLYLFSPITFEYRLVDSPHQPQVEAPLKDNEPNPDEVDEPTPTSFNMKYFAFLLVPFGLLAIWLTLNFQNKFKIRKREMIK